MSAPTSWRTAITEADDQGVYIRGYDLRDLVGELSFAEAFLLLARGELPNPGEARMLDAILVSVIDRGIVPCSIVTRYLASSGSPLQAAVAGGVASFGDVYGGAAQQLAQALSEHAAPVRAGTQTLDAAADAVVASFRGRSERIPGYGSAVHRSGDPRVARLFEIAERNGVLREHSRLALAVEGALERATRRKLGMNQDGALAALGLDLGIDWRLVRALAFVPRSAGLAVHALEEMTRETGWRHVPNEAVAYDGPPRRKLPQRSRS